MSRNQRLSILLFVIIVFPVAPVRAGETLSDLAERFTTPAPANVSEPASAGGSVASPESPESQPLGPVDPAADSLVSARNDTSSLSSGSWIMDTLTALGVVLGIILGLRWLYLRYAGRGIAVARSTPVVEVLARTSVAPRNHVLLLRVGSRILVVSDAGSSGMRTLADIEDPEEVASLIGAVSVTRDNSMTKNFTRLFHSFNGQYDEQRTDLEGGDDDEHAVDRARDSLSSLLNRVRILGNRGGAAG